MATPCHFIFCTNDYKNIPQCAKIPIMGNHIFDHPLYKAAAIASKVYVLNKVLFLSYKMTPTSYRDGRPFMGKADLVDPI